MPARPCYLRRMHTFLAGRLAVVQADITTLDVDLIVNAANQSLLGGGGVDRAIHRAAGPELLAACRALGGARTGEVKVTPGFELPARYIAHAVGPVWKGGGAGEAALLASCYRSALREAAERGLRTVAFPSISTGIFGFPLDQAAPIALRTIAEGLRLHEGLERVTMCCFSTHDLATYSAEAERLGG